MCVVVAFSTNLIGSHAWSRVFWIWRLTQSSRSLPKNKAFLRLHSLSYLEYRFRRHPRMPISLRTTRCASGRHTARCEQFRRLTPSPPSPCWGETWGNWRTQCGLCTEARPGPSACPKQWQCGRPRRSRWWDDQPWTHSLPTRRRDDPCIWKM